MSIQRYLVVGWGALLSWSCDAASASRVCLPVDPAPSLIFNHAPRLALDAAGNAVVWWRTTDERPHPYSAVEGETRAAVLGEGGFARAGRPEDSFDEAVFAGAGRLIVGAVTSDHVVVRIHANDCDVATHRFEGTALELSLAANASGDALLAWGRDHPAGQELELSRVAPGGGVLGPQTLLQSDHEQIRPRVAIDRMGNALVAFSKPEPSAPNELTYQAQVSVSRGGEFRPPQQIFEGNQIELASTATGDALLVGVSTRAVSSLHAARLDSDRRWHVFPEYSCHDSSCDVRFGISSGGQTVLMAERTAAALHVYALADDENREELRIERSDPADPMVSHALDVLENGDATLVWLTPRGIHSSHFTVEHGWSKPALRHSLTLELESMWGTLRYDPTLPAWNEYPMQVKRLPGGRDLIVWSQYDDLVTRQHSDVLYRVATKSSAWSLSVAIDGDGTQVQRLSGGE